MLKSKNRQNFSIDYFKYLFEEKNIGKVRDATNTNYSTRANKKEIKENNGILKYYVHQKGFLTMK